MKSPLGIVFFFYIILYNPQELFVNYYLFPGTPTISETKVESPEAIIKIKQLLFTCSGKDYTATSFFHLKIETMATLSPTPIPHHNVSPHLHRSPPYNIVTLPHPRLSLSLHKYSSPLVQFPKLAYPISICKNKSKAQPKIAYDLSFAQKASFAENGYLILSDVLSPTEIISLKIWAQEIHDLPRTPDCPYLPYEEINRLTGERVLCRTENFVSSHKGFDSLLRGKTFIKILEQLAGKEMLLFKEKSEPLSQKLRNSSETDKQKKSTTNLQALVVSAHT